MFEANKNSELFNFFAEERLVFKRRLGGKGEKPSSEGGSLAGNISRLRDMLRKSEEGFEEDRDTSEPPSGVYTGPEHTRQRRAPKPYHEDTVKGAAEALKYGEFLSPEKLNWIQRTHEKLYTAYMNPSFMLYLSGDLDRYDKVYGALDLIMKHPYQFKYTPGGHTMVITKRRPGKQKSPDVPEDFGEVVMERKGAEWHVIKVAADDLREGSDMPWKTHEKYHNLMEFYDESFKHDVQVGLKDFFEYTRPPRRPGYSAAKAYELWEKGLNSVDAEKKAIHVLHQVHIPQRYADLVRARKDDYPFEFNDDRVQHFLTQQAAHGKTYKDVTVDYFENEFVEVSVDTTSEKAKGVTAIYIIDTGTYTFRIDQRGYLLQPLPPDNKLGPDPRYANVVRRRYLTETEGALERVGDDADKKEIADHETATKRAEKIAEVMEKRAEVDILLQDEDIKENILLLKEVLKTLSKEWLDNPETRAATETRIEDFKEPAKLLSTINETLNWSYGMGNPDDEGYVPPNMEPLEAALQILKKFKEEAKPAGS